MKRAIDEEEERKRRMKKSVNKMDHKVVVKVDNNCTCCFACVIQ